MNTKIILLAGIFSFLNVAIAENTSDEFIGKWTGVSKNIYSIYGDLSIRKNTLDFQYQGKFDYKIVENQSNFIVIKLNKKLRCGNFVRLGPIRPNDDISAGNMEFSVYENEEKAFSIENGYCSWGLYQRQ